MSPRTHNSSLRPFRWLALFALIAASSAASADDARPLRVLFLGNSLTHYNDLPGMVESLSIAAGVERPIQAERIAPGGETFYRHSERRGPGSPLEVLARGGWDVVVLQENGRVAARSAGESFTFAARLVRAAREAGAEPLFYMTWAYRDRPETHDTVVKTYRLLGQRLEVPVAPVGIAWRHVRDTLPDVELFHADGVHPSPAGSYLAACVLFATLTRHNPVGVGLDDLPPGVTAEDARRLQEIAWQVSSRVTHPQHPNQPQ